MRLRLCAAGIILITAWPVRAIPQQVRVVSESLVTPNAGMTPPTVLHSVEPLYTDIASVLGIEGVVTVLAEVGIDGQLKVIRMVKGLGYGLDEKALEALGQWRFLPAYRTGTKVNVVTHIDVPFSLPDGSEALPERARAWFRHFAEQRGGAPRNAIIRANGIVATFAIVEPENVEDALPRPAEGKVILQARMRRKDGTVQIVRVIEEINAVADDGR